jgi:hypothetical protein
MGDGWGGFGMGLGCAPLSRNPNPYSLRGTFFIHCMCACFTSAGISEHGTLLALFLQSEKQWPLVCQRPHMKVPFSLALSFKFNPAKVLHCSPSLNFKLTHWCLFLTPRSGDPFLLFLPLLLCIVLLLLLILLPFLGLSEGFLGRHFLETGRESPPQIVQG